MPASSNVIILVSSSLDLHTREKVIVFVIVIGNNLIVIVISLTVIACNCNL